jgi:hypothetical protein
MYKYGCVFRYLGTPDITLCLRTGDKFPRQFVIRILRQSQRIELRMTNNCAEARRLGFKALPQKRGISGVLR